MVCRALGFVSILVMLVTTPAFAKTAKAPDMDTLPTPAELRPDVAFWEMVFSRYDKDQCVLHDSWDLSVIYGVERLPLGSVRARTNAANSYKRKIANALRRKAQGYAASNNFERKIYRSIPKTWTSKAQLLAAVENVRCQQGVATNFRASLQRSKQHLPMIRKIFEERGLPADLAYLPHLESGFNTQAHSKVGARGLWQLMPYTARGSMQVNRRADERLNPRIATRFAADFLQDNYRQVQSWPLALTGYNYGINGVVRATRRHQTNDYIYIRTNHRSRIFGFAARNFYPSFLAARNLAKAHEQRLVAEDESRSKRSAKKDAKASVAL